MGDYLKSENKKLLEIILRNQLVVWDLSDESELRKIVKGKGGGNRTESEINLTILGLNWCASSIDHYVSEKGGICKAEIKLVGSEILKVAPWQFNQYLLETKVEKEKEITSLKGLLLEMEKPILSEKLSSLLKSFKHNKKLLYEDVINKNHLMFYEERGPCMDYIEESFFDDKKKTNAPQKIIIPDVYHKNKLNVPNKENNPSEKKNDYSGSELVANINKEFELNAGLKAEVSLEDIEVGVNSPESFAKKYELEDKFYEGQSPISAGELERALILGGLKNQDDIRKFKSMIRSNYFFSKVLFVPKSELYSKEKIRHLVSFHIDKTDEEQTSLLGDIVNAFGVTIR